MEERAGVSRALALLELPEDLPGRVAGGELAPFVADELAEFGDPVAQRQVADRVAAQPADRLGDVDLRPPMYPPHSAEVGRSAMWLSSRDAIHPRSASGGRRSSDGRFGPDLLGDNTGPESAPDLCPSSSLPAARSAPLLTSAGA
jgi:hypothetical protein